MNKKPNFKTVAQRALWRLPRIEKQEDKQKYLEAVLRDLYEGGMVYAAKQLKPPAKNITAKIKTNPIDDTLAGLLNLGETMESLSRDLAGVG